MPTAPSQDFTFIENGTRAAGGISITNAAASAIVVRSDYPSFAADLTTGPTLRIGLLLGAACWIEQRGDRFALSARWRAGSLVVTPPHSSVRSSTGAMTMLGLAIDLDRHGAIVADGIDPVIWENAASRIHHDRLSAAVLQAMWLDAELHGASSAFFEHGAALVVRRLAQLASTAGRRTPGLSARQLACVDEMLDRALARDISVADMADAAKMDPSGFTRAMRASTGETPYAYLTRRRMAEARQLLSVGRSVTQAAHAVGYANASKFASAFRRVFGCAPSALK